MNLKDETFVDFDPDVDPAVSAFLGQGSQKLVERRLPPNERKRRAKERAKIRERRAKRVTYDQPPDLRRKVASIAKEQGVPASSQLAAWLLARGLERLGETSQERRTALSSYRSPSNIPRYEWNLHLEPSKALAP